MTRTLRATRESQWVGQCDATPRGDANHQTYSQLGSSAVSADVNMECVVRPFHYDGLNSPLELAHTARRLIRDGRG